jgi:hypothetical protein
MGIFSDFIGTMSSLFRVGGTSGANLKFNSSGLEHKNAADTAFVTARSLPIASGSTINDNATQIDLRGRVAQIGFSFSGGSAPSAGTNTGKFGFCHTSGGSYTAGDVVYDDGTTTLSNFKITYPLHITTTSSISGTISMIANGIYSNDAGTWTLKGDGAGSGTGNVQFVELNIAFGSGNVDSTTSIPDGARILGVDTVVTTAFDGTAPTVAVKINGSSPVTVQATTANNLKVVNQYKTTAITQIGSTGAGVVRATVTPDSSTVGAAVIYVWYVTASNA